MLIIVLQGLSGDMGDREVLIEELRSAASPLASSCDPEVTQRIETAVSEAVVAYNDTCNNLKQLCDK